MSQDVLVSVDNVSKKFCRSLRRSLWYGVCDIAAEFNPSRNGSRALDAECRTRLSTDVAHRAAEDNLAIRPEEFWAVRNVSIQLRRGECLGLIGRNGAGKTTLLKMLNGLIKPDTGRIEMRGQVAAMIALGAGFNPILSGRENIYVAGSLRGMKKKEIDAKFDEIVDFSEIGDFIDAPVQSYSSGMQVRLGFSVAVSLEPDILLIDEVLAVGDAGFKQKAYNAITKIIENSAVVFVSHSIVQLAKVCNRGMLLQQGKIGAVSSRVEDVINEYFRQFPSGPVRVGGSGKATLLGMKIDVFEGSPRAFSYDFRSTSELVNAHELIIRHGTPISFEFLIEVAPTIERFHVELRFSDTELRSVAQCSSVNSNHAFSNKAPSPTRARLTLPALLFNKGRFAVNIAVLAEHIRGVKMGEILCTYENLFEFQVSADAVMYGSVPIQLHGHWYE